MPRPGIPVLENSVSIGILLWLLENDGATKQALYDGVSHTSSMPIRLAELESSGLIETAPVGRHSRATAVYLTDEGRIVAERLGEISSVLESISDRRCLIPIIRIRAGYWFKFSHFADLIIFE